MAQEGQLRVDEDGWYKQGALSHYFHNLSRNWTKYFYKAIIQSVLLYGAESWTLTGRMIRRLSSIHNRVARYITGRHIKELEDGTYYCPPTEEVLDAAGLEGTTIQKHAMSSTIYWKCRLGNGVVNWDIRIRKSKAIRSQTWNYLMNRFNAWTMRVSSGVGKRNVSVVFFVCIFICRMCLEKAPAL